MSKIIRTTLAVLAIAVMLTPVLVFALTTPTPPVGDPTTDAIDLDEIQQLVEKVAQFLIIVSVVIAVIFIIWGGTMYMAARGDADKAEAAKTTIYNGVIGAAVVLGVGVILQTLAGVITRSFFV